MVAISCLLCTARDEFPIIGLPNTHIFQPTFDSLEKQTFKNFELVIVDSLWPQKKKWIEEGNWSFPIKYVPVHPNHRFWLDQKRWSVCGSLNSAIIHAETDDLLVRIDDCSEFKDDFLQKFWSGYDHGYFPLAMHTRYRNGRQAYYNEEYRQEGYDAYKREEIPKESVQREIRLKALDKIFNKGDPVRDTRWPIVERRGGNMIGPPNWYYGYSSLSLQAALKVNGYNELFDLDKGQEDQEMGLRLSMAGYGNMFLLDVNHWVIEHEHEGVSSSVIESGRNVKCNYAIYLLNERKKRWRANSEKLTEEDVKLIIEESLKAPCSPQPHFYDEDCEGELFKLWLSHQPLFDLREESIKMGVP